MLLILLGENVCSYSRYTRASPGTRQRCLALTMCLTYRDADETKEWIEEKNQALNTDNYGHDLASVQALQRKHEGFERDLAALGDKVRDA